MQALPVSHTRNSTEQALTKPMPSDPMAPVPHAGYTWLAIPELLAEPIASAVALQECGAP